MQIAPKEDELASLQAFQGDRRLVSPPEQFLLMMAEIPRIVDKLNVLRSLQQFEARPFPPLTPYMIKHVPQTAASQMDCKLRCSIIACAQSPRADSCVQKCKMIHYDTSSMYIIK